jgi:thiosulfate/3-mercaptopyruvate sulfurtransferase
MAFADPLISPEELAGLIGTPGLHVLAVDCVVPSRDRLAHARFLSAHVPGARFFDIDAASDPQSTLPHMLATPDHFEGYVQGFGINAGDHIVIYDDVGMMLSPRAWWMFRAMGHDRVQVLDGGYPAWQAAALKTETGEPAPADVGNFHARAVPAVVRSAEQVASATERGELVVDVRSAERFSGSVGEPWLGRVSGHMPGSRNLPNTELIDPASKRMLSATALRQRFDAAGIDNRPVVCSCGSGVTACILALALERAGTKQWSVYDGSWAEWGLPQSGRPVMTGPAS